MVCIFLRDNEIINFTQICICSHRNILIEREHFEIRGFVSLSLSLVSYVSICKTNVELPLTPLETENSVRLQLYGFDYKSDEFYNDRNLQRNNLQSAQNLRIAIIRAKLVEV